MQKWQKGNQYNKLPLWKFKVFNTVFDAFILYYHHPTFLGWHRDVVDGAKHYRLNFKLKGKSTLFIEGEKRQKSINFPIAFFRSDLLPHAVEVRTPTIKLSLGIIHYTKNKTLCTEW